MIAELQQAVANYAHALDELNVPELETVLTEDTTWTFTMPGQGMLGPVAGRAAVPAAAEESAPAGDADESAVPAAETRSEDEAGPEKEAPLTRNQVAEAVGEVLAQELAPALSRWRAAWEDPRS
ncbi:nuclear transport factor 2 family protein [Streptomyces sp. NPDC058439]|uniref:nuclear transport factor 2 family protein n=1 Tax=Streptomyces sp. NPDC058439 TaxID=3346500 RepID=UPI0036682F5E